MMSGMLARYFCVGAVVREGEGEGVGLGVALAVSVEVELAVGVGVGVGVALLVWAALGLAGWEAAGAAEAAGGAVSAAEALPVAEAVQLGVACPLPLLLALALTEAVPVPAPLLLPAAVAVDSTAVLGVAALSGESVPATEAEGEAVPLLQPLPLAVAQLLPVPLALPLPPVLLTLPLTDPCPRAELREAEAVREAAGEALRLPAAERVVEGVAREVPLGSCREGEMEALPLPVAWLLLAEEEGLVLAVGVGSMALTVKVAVCPAAWLLVAAAPVREGVGESVPGMPAEVEGELLLEGCSEAVPGAVPEALGRALEGEGLPEGEGALLGVRGPLAVPRRPPGLLLPLAQAEAESVAHWEKEGVALGQGDTVAAAGEGECVAEVVEEAEADSPMEAVKEEDTEWQ